MYYWKTKKLAENLKKNALNQAEYKNYYLATSVLILIGYYLVILDPPKTLLAVLFEAIGSILITIIGLNIIFRVNGGNSGVSFLDRVVSLSFPLLIKIVVVGFALGIVLETLRQLGGANDEQLNWLYSSSVLLIQVGFFWRLKVYIQYLNA
jgi:hypothetical protein